LTLGEGAAAGPPAGPSPLGQAQKINPGTSHAHRIGQAAYKNAWSHPTPSI
jgi:hypothetical protein